jgi:hypothetical protein
MESSPGAIRDIDKPSAVKIHIVGLGLLRNRAAKR